MMLSICIFIIFHYNSPIEKHLLQMMETNAILFPEKRFGPIPGLSDILFFLSLHTVK